MKKLLLMLAISLSMTGVSMADQRKPPERSQARRTSTYIVWTSSRIGIHKSYIPIGRLNIPIFGPVIRHRQDFIRIHPYR